ncbi:class I glutamine amidotransferase-like protein [Mollisia scopiformis]|uniref:Class I glutamine amidotransferase-like protein n=1 Tax=Mollisia scopiformis TaxID=149040 RepID=A0A194XXX6_MOLSC|nr:class I glutamine amidotransferase-like protein [Mollisia scopiformis]KUJ24687.1 class I glutamine amidotransferase-like protein [Mollisia scopiformis]
MSKCIKYHLYSPPNQSKHSDQKLAPTRYGVVIFPGFEVLDVFGPLEAFNALSLSYQLNLTLIAKTLDPVTSKPQSAAMNLFNSTFGESIVPTHTFDTAPDLDVLLVPGGLGTRAPSAQLESLIAFIKERFPKLKYLITVCTGAGLAARAGVLDGKHATTNKKAWVSTTAWGPKVRWVAQARWVQDGNVFTSSGVSAGIDVTMAFIDTVYGNTTATSVANYMEYERHPNSTDDPFAPLYGLTDANNSTNQK